MFPTTTSYIILHFSPLSSPTSPHPPPPHPSWSQVVTTLWLCTKLDNSKSLSTRPNVLPSTVEPWPKTEGTANCCPLLVCVCECEGGCWEGGPPPLFSHLLTDSQDLFPYAEWGMLLISDQLLLSVERSWSGRQIKISNLWRETLAPQLFEIIWIISNFTSPESQIWVRVRSTLMHYILFSPFSVFKYL